jgi:hypothetical protein
MSHPETSVASSTGVSDESPPDGADSHEEKWRIAVRLMQKLREAGFACELSLHLKDAEKQAASVLN